jgi:hypothetical protein
MKFGKEIWAGLFGEAGEGSRKAEALVAGCVACAAMPTLAWQIAAMTSAFIIGRAIHDSAAADLDDE